MMTKQVLAARYGLESPDELTFCNAIAEVKSDDVIDPMLFTARISTNAVDNDAEVLLPRGMITTRFDKSGAGFWNHNYAQPIFVPEGKLTRTDTYVEGKGRFLERPADWQGEWFPDYVRAFVGAMSSSGKKVGVSVGFIPIETREPSKKDVAMFGENVRRVISKWELLEWSIAPVQANAEAYITAVGKSLDKTAYKALFAADPPDPAPDACSSVIGDSSTTDTVIDPVSAATDDANAVVKRRKRYILVVQNGIENYLSDAVHRSFELARGQLWTK